MRAVKTVISAAGNLKRENPEMSEVIGAILIFPFLTLPILIAIGLSQEMNLTKRKVRYGTFSSLLHGIQRWLRHFFERPKNKRVSHF